MVGRLSEDSLKAVYDVGHKAVSLSTKSLTTNHNLMVPRLNDIIMKDGGVDEIRSMLPIDIYRGLLDVGAENALEVLEVLTDEQVTGILDYDVWKQDHLIPKQVFYWLSLFGEISPEHMYKRFTKLEEEYQLAVMGPFIKIYDEEEFEALSEQKQDELYALPANALYYEIKSEDKTQAATIEQLIQASMASDMSYAISLLAHSAYLPPAEQEQLISQFRKARIEEDGFVSYEESLRIFSRIDLDIMQRKWVSLSSYNLSLDYKPQVIERSKSFLDDVIRFASKNIWAQDEVTSIQRGFVFLSNSLCAASQVETDDIHGIKNIMTHARSLSSLGLEFLSQGNVEAAVEILGHEVPKTLFQIGLSLVDNVRQLTLEGLENMSFEGFSDFKKLVRMEKYGSILEYIDLYWSESLGFLNTEVLKGLFNRYPVYPHEKVKNFEGEYTKVIFSPISSMQELADLAAQVDALLASIRLLPASKELVSLEQTVLIAVFNALVKGGYSSDKILMDDIEAFIKMEDDKVDSLSNEFLNAYSENLLVNKDWSFFEEKTNLIPYNKRQPVDLAVAHISETLFSLKALRAEAKSAGEHVLTSILNVDTQLMH